MRQVSVRGSARGTPGSGSRRRDAKAPAEKSACEVRAFAPGPRIFARRRLGRPQRLTPAWLKSRRSIECVRRHREYASHAAGVRDAPLRRLPRRRECPLAPRFHKWRLSSTSRGSEVTYVHCGAGVSRACTSVAAYLMERLLVRRRGAPHRPESATTVPPNAGFKDSSGRGRSAPRRGEARAVRPRRLPRSERVVVTVVRCVSK